MTAIAIQRREQIIQGLQAGRYLKDIAAELGVSHAAISQYLATDPDYVKAREIGAGEKIEARERELEVAPDALTLARARELLSHARWRAEREFPHRWGQRQEITHRAPDGPLLSISVAITPTSQSSMTVHPEIEDTR